MNPDAAWRSICHEILDRLSQAADLDARTLEQITEALEARQDIFWKYCELLRLTKDKDKLWEVCIRGAILQ